MTQATSSFPPGPPVAVIPLHLVLATPAKVLCSAVFLSGRALTEATQNSGLHALFVHHLHDVLLDLLDVQVDEAARELSVSVELTESNVERIVAGYRRYYEDFEADWDKEKARLVLEGRVTRTARFLGDQGSIILPMEAQALGFTPVRVESRLPAAETQDWPMGDRLTSPHHSSSLDRQALSSAVDVAFEDPAAFTAAVAVVHNGELVAERYRQGVDMNTQLESWSMGKSLTATLVGVLVQQGLLSLDQPAPVKKWQHQGDPRAAITIRDLLQMSGGLRFSGQDDPRRDWRLGVPDHLYIYSDAVDAFQFAVNGEAEFSPGTVGRYLNCDPLTLGYIVKQTVTETLGVEYLTWPQSALFDRIGIRRQVLETDWYGNFLLTGFDYGTARNWARLGLLYLQDGVWEGHRVLPEGWSDFVSAPAPGWSEPKYGGQFWLNGIGEFTLSESAYMMAGFGEQRVFVVASHELVIVRMGHRADTDATRESTNAMLTAVMDTFA